MLTYIYFIIILVIYSPYCYASINEWYFGIQGGISSLTGTHHYANAGDGDKEKDNKNQKSQESSLAKDYRNLQDNYQRQIDAFNNFDEIARGVDNAVDAQGMRKKAHTPVGMIDDMPRKVFPQTLAAGAPPPPPPPPSAGVINTTNPTLHLNLNNPPPPSPPLGIQPDVAPIVINNPPPPSGLQPHVAPIVIKRNNYSPPPSPPPKQTPYKSGEISHRYGDIKLNERSQIFGLHIGFLKNFDNFRKFVIGSELFCNFNNSVTVKDLKVDNRAPEGKISIKQPYTYGITGMSGYYISPRTLFYGKAGIEMNKFINEYYDLRFVGSSYPYNQYPSRERYSFSLRGIVSGLGVKFSSTQRTDLSLEYQYSMMQKIHLRSDEVTINSVNRGYLFRPNQHRLMLKLSYFIK